MRAELLSRNRLSAASLLSTLALVATAGLPAGAHGPAPAPLEVLGMDTVDDRASLARTSIGLARSHASGGWTYVCPSQWGNYERALASLTVSGDLLVTVGGGDVYRSTDGACTFEAVPTDDSWYGLEAVAWGEQVWVPATSSLDDDTTALLAIGPTGAAVVARRWEADEAFGCDGVHGWKHGDGEVLLAAGASPSPSLWRAEGDLTDPASLTWSSEAMDELPVETGHISIQTVTATGEIWLLLSSPAGRELWQGTPAVPGTVQAFTWASVGAPATSIHGPVRVADRWLVVRDGVLESGDDAGSWESLEPVNWTCLHQVSEVAIACTLTTAVAIDALTADGAQTHPIFEMTQLLPPLEGCPSAGDSASSCQSDWVHFGAEVGLLDPNQLSTPNETGDEAKADKPTASQGCATTHSGQPVAPLTLLVLLALLVGIRRRRSLAPTINER